MENIQGWMITAIVAILAFLGSLIDSRRQFTEKIRRNHDAIDAHKDNPVAHAQYLVDRARYAEDRIDFKETLKEVKDAVSGVHRRLDDIKNGKGRPSALD